ncbi:DUF1620-domain-containing protein [Pholiota conissans]|uniref:ER membrane protein complex subunit 1 n=1 Tax=Pholiota conissans TaxID=109636 RepID=A0A9P6CVV9_9AGAR|nr:DUF1620-domain-containing protein [Pholiota conissans]
MRLLASAVSFLSLFAGTWALHESDVGVVDWHKHLVGVPLSGLVSAAPSFHRSGDKSLILTATANNVLAALEPEDGSVLWRYIFDPEDRIIGYFKGDNVVATLSAPGGATLRTFDTITGDLLLEKRMHAPETGALSEPAHFGKDVVFALNSTDLYVLTNGCTVTKLNGTTGEVMWSWSSEDRGTKVISSKLILTPDALYAVGVGQSTASYALHVRTLSPTTGELIKDNGISSSIIDPLTQLITLSSSDPSKPIVLWLDKGTLRYFALTPTLNEKPRLMKGAGFAQLVNLGLNHLGHAVITREDGSSFVVKVDEESGYPRSIWEYQDSLIRTKAKSDDHTDSTFAGGVDSLGRPFVARIFWSHKMGKGSADVFAGHLVEGQGLASGYFFPFDTINHGIIAHAALDSENPAGWTIHSRLLITTTTGSVQLWEQSGLKWAREESLATTVIAELVEIPEKVASEIGSGVGDGFIARLTRQIADAQDFPQYLFHFVKRFVTGSYASATDAALPTSSSPSEGMTRDTFGFRQIIVAATVYGKVFGLDSSNGDIVWSRVLGLGWAEEIGGMIQPVKLFVVKTVSDGGDPEVVLVGQRRASNSLVDTVVFHMNALTGADITGTSVDTAILEGQDIIQGPLVNGFLLNAEKRVVVLLDEFLQVYLYPDTPETREVFTAASPQLSFPLRGNVETRQRIIGHKIPPPDSNHRPVAYPIWSLTLPDGETVQALLPQAAHGPVASVGKVLGNRTTLYKYLNPRLFVALTAVPTRGVCGVYVADTAKGTVLYHAEVKATSSGKGAGSGCDVKAMLVENWLVYHYYENEVAGGTVGDTVGYRMVSVEFYEGQKTDQKIESSDLSPYSNDTLNFQILEKAYVFPYAITALVPTTTKFGITSKDIIVATANHRIQSFPRRVLDPRRPNRKVTSEEAEEYLFTYDPLLPNDPRRVLSHNYDVANVHHIITSPALLESTSLVFAYGLDMFLTRVAPSNTFDVLSENFNKAQLVITITGLLVAILITRPMVQRKKLREKWYQS